MSETQSYIIRRLTTLAQARGQSVAVRSMHACTADQRLTYADLWSTALHQAGRLRREFDPESVVILAAPNSLEFIVAALSVLTAGLRLFVVSHALTAPELKAAAEDSAAQAVIGGEAARQVAEALRIGWIDLAEFRDQTREPCTFEPNWGDLLLQSSGTTGQQRIVLRSGEAIDAVACNVVETVGLSQDDRVLVTVPLAHSYGIENGMLAPLTAGASILLCHGFDPATVVAALANGATVFPGVPFMFDVLAASSDLLECPTLRCAYSAGAPLPASVAERFHGRTGVVLGQLYGATEVGSVTFADPRHDHFVPGSVGKPMRGVRIRIADTECPHLSRSMPARTEGHVLVSAPSMLQGYVGSEPPAVSDGFMAMGDLGYVDDRGNLFITGRTSFQIEIGGLKVNPLEIEQVLSRHPGVADCAVVPMRITETVNRLRAIIVPQPGSREAHPEALRAFARRQLASWKVPRVFEFRDALPRTATGKLLRQAIQ